LARATQRYGGVCVGDRYVYVPDRVVTHEDVEDVLRRVGIGEDELVEILGPSHLASTVPRPGPRV
jgi:hypothetical protein